MLLDLQSGMDFNSINSSVPHKGCQSFVHSFFGINLTNSTCTLPLFHTKIQAVEMLNADPSIGTLSMSNQISWPFSQGFFFQRSTQLFSQQNDQKTIDNFPQKNTF